MKQSVHKAEHKSDQNQKIITLSDLVGIAGYKGPRIPTKYLGFRVAKAKK